MDKYTELKEILKSYLEKTDIELTKEQISAYYLYKIVDEKLEKLRNVSFDQEIIKKINKGLSLRSIGKFFDKSNSIFYLKCQNLYVQCNMRTSILEFQFAPSERNLDYKRRCLDIRKEVGIDEIYFGSKMIDKQFVTKYFDEISEIFNVLEEFSALYQGGVGNVGKDSKILFSDGFFDIVFHYDSYGRTDIDISIKKEIDPENIYYRNWFERQKLSDYVEENKEEILRKIPVNMNELNYTTNTIIKESTSKMNIPVLVKKK